MGAVVGSLLAAALAVPGLFFSLMGAIAMSGHGDPTWNDGEEVWALPLGLLLLLPAVVTLVLAVRGVRRRR